MTIEPWSTVDWSKTTTAIAAERSVSISTVSKARARYAPNTLAANSRRPTATAPRPPRAQKPVKHPAAPAHARTTQLERELEQARAQLTIARRAFTTTEALLRDVLDQRDTAQAELDRIKSGRTIRPELLTALNRAVTTHPDLTTALAGQLTDSWVPHAKGGPSAHREERT
jgi:hypothetical protein